MNVVEEGLKSALRAKQCELLSVKLELWRERFNRANEQYDRYEKELEEAREQLREGGGQR